MLLGVSPQTTRLRSPWGHVVRRRHREGGQPSSLWPPKSVWGAEAWAARGRTPGRVFLRPKVRGALPGRSSQRQGLPSPPGSSSRAQNVAGQGCLKAESLSPKAGAEHSGASLTPRLQVPSRSRPCSLRANNYFKGSGPCFATHFWVPSLYLSLCISLSLSLSLSLSPHSLHQERLCQTLAWSTVTIDQPCVLGSFLTLCSYLPCKFAVRIESLACIKSFVQ